MQHSLQAMLEFYHNNILSLNTIVDKMCHTPADVFNISQRGYIRKGYWADLVLIDPNRKMQVAQDNLLYKCGWSPLEGLTFRSSISHTIINGQIAYQNGNVQETQHARKLAFKKR